MHILPAPYLEMRTGFLEVLLDTFSTKNNNFLCLLVLRNLSFYGPSKTLLVSNGVHCAVCSALHAPCVNNTCCYAECRNSIMITHYYIQDV